ncbi:MAG: hypothetical protein HYX68_08370 [Planctomycetes bacterium]|nr:hypothetical protein [Planctomycetota bacterium]
MKFDTFKKGERYWVAFASPYEWKRCPQGAVQSWPEKDAPKLMEEAVRADYYAHRPFFDPDSGFTFSHRSAQNQKSWRVRMERDGKLLWERLEGVLQLNACSQQALLQYDFSPTKMAVSRLEKSFRCGKLGKKSNSKTLGKKSNSKTPS